MAKGRSRRVYYYLRNSIIFRNVCHSRVKRINGKILKTALNNSNLIHLFHCVFLKSKLFNLKVLVFDYMLGQLKIFVVPYFIQLSTNSINYMKNRNNIRCVNTDICWKNIRMNSFINWSGVRY